MAKEIASRTQLQKFFNIRKQEQLKTTRKNREQAKISQNYDNKSEQ